MNDIEDQQCVARCLGDDMNAFSRLVDCHGDAVYNLACRMCGNTSAAEDMAQETFIRAYRKLHQYKPEYPFRNWVLGICANLCRSRYRWWQRKRKLEQNYAQETLFQEQTRQAATGADPVQPVLERALMELPETLRTPLTLKYMEQMSIQQIAQILGVGLSAVKMRLTRGRAQLVHLLNNANADKGDTHD